jgi:hypothetical protein
MTVTVDKTLPKTPRDRRWLRIAGPFAALFALIIGTLIVHAIEQPDPDDAAYLSPESVDGIGSGVLAARLLNRGVTIERKTTTTSAITAVSVGGTDATLFVTTPGLVELDRLSTPGTLRPGTRVVVVAPPAEALQAAAWPVAVSGTRWTTEVTDPDCADLQATVAGPAAVHHVSFTPQTPSSCYDSSLITVVTGGVTVTFVGAADPFRNDRIDEHGNSALAVGLLAKASRVVWLDVHQRETPPTFSSPPTREATPEPEFTESSGAPTATFTPGDSDDDPVEEPEQAQQDEPNPLSEAFPSAVWATIVLLALMLLALALAAARRLGAPVSEPLPSRVPANETMLGHARLYQKARARSASLDILREAARRRLTEHLGLPPGATITDIAEHAGYEVDDVREILAGVHPDDDDELIAAAIAVQDLVREITGFEGEQP